MSVDAEYVDHMGDELTVVNAARVSYGSNHQVLTVGDKKLIKYLADHDHMSPFEHCTLTMKIECPLYIRSQIHRHRTFSYNEISRRYTDKDLEFADWDVYRLQSQSNKQASYGALGGPENEAVRIEIQEHNQRCLELYESLLAMGICREQARGVLPQDLMTKFYMTGNLRNWIHFIKLRLHEGAQYEVQIVAKQCRRVLIDKFGYAAEVLLKEKEDEDNV